MYTKEQLDRMKELAVALRKCFYEFSYQLNMYGADTREIDCYVEELTEYFIEQNEDLS